MAAAMLKRANLREIQMPFDWLFCQPSIAHKIIEDDFLNFADLKKITSLSFERGHPCSSNSHYDDGTLSRPFFAHKDLTRPSDFSYYERSIIEFKRHAKEGMTVFLIEEFGEIEHWFLPLCELFDHRYPNSRIFAVRHASMQSGVSLTQSTKTKNGQLWRFDGSKVVAGTALENRVHEDLIMDELCRAYN